MFSEVRAERGLADFLQEVDNASQFPTVPALRQIKIFDENSVFVYDFHDFNFYLT